ncbi:MAG: hypothetical protein IJ021_06000 [Clostridia bacterium]|nr:hypothetical protein [Clostridia bacterium]
MRKTAIICLLFVLCLCFCSCTDADIVILAGQSRSESAFPEKGPVAVTVNLSSGMFHTDESCRHAVNIKEENRKIIFYRDAQEALDDGFEPCSVCAGKFKTTEENND